MIFLGKLIPVVADEVKLTGETLVADHVGRPLPVRRTVADLGRERNVVLQKILGRDSTDLTGVGKSRRSDNSAENRGCHLVVPVGPHQALVRED